MVSIKAKIELTTILRQTPDASQPEQAWIRNLLFARAATTAYKI